MKVVKPGRAQKGWAKEFACVSDGGCGSTLLVEQSDLWETSHTDYQGDTDYYIHFKCGHCGLTNTRNARCVPYDLEIKGRK